MIGLPNDLHAYAIGVFLCRLAISAAAAAIAGLSASITAIAGPSPEMQYLIHEPASMLDLGLLKLRDAVTALVNDDPRLSALGLKPPLNVDTSYNLERNQIHIFIGAPLPPSYLIQNKPRETCGQLIRLLQTWMNSDAKWTQSFTHSGYAANARVDSAIKAKLPGTIVINAAVGPDSNGKTESCSGTLSSPEITYSLPRLQ